ncbi:sulfite exporter TauE/SafE family protein [Candidatus Omnitrophota bacterium]
MEFNVVIIILLAFCCEFIDSSIGMGYGTSLTPILLIMGFTPLEIVPAVLFSEAVSGTTAAFFHHRLNNARFERRSRDTHVATVLSLCSIIGTVAGVFLAIKLPTRILKLGIASIVIIMGIFILVTIKRKPRFTWRKIMTVGVIASLNKGMSGGGYGPLVMGGQLLSGVGVKNAIGITSLAEGLTCFIGVILFVLFKHDIDWSLAPWLMTGAVLSVPFAAHTLKKLPEQKVKLVIAVIMLILGCLTIFKTFH